MQDFILVIIINQMDLIDELGKILVDVVIYIIRPLRC